MFDCTDQKYKHIVLFSGGMDSYITLKYVAKDSPADLTALYFHLSHRYEEMESRAASFLWWETVHDSSLASLGKLEDQGAYIPARNAHLIMSAIRYLQKDRKGVIWLTVQEDEMSIPDRSIAFMDGISDVASELHGEEVLVKTPWMSKDKTDMVRWYLDNGYQKERLLDTWSCYTRGGRPCGQCAACIRRYIALSLNGIHEEYILNPKHSSLADEYRLRASRGEYSDKRCERIRRAL
jgi:7-cyano-7-deazaguanine synthase in queuosine biosynthesis